MYSIDSPVILKTRPLIPKRKIKLPFGCRQSPGFKRGSFRTSRNADLIFSFGIRVNLTLNASIKCMFKLWVDMTSQIYDSPLAFVAIQAALKAGQLLRKGFGTQFEITSKANALDLVTEFDRMSEEIIINFIRSQFADHAFLAEESGPSDNQHAEVLWVIDPLDGTMNFAHHIPHFAISIAALIKEQIEIGVIYHPINNELFVAHRGRGAYLNGSRLQVSPIETMASAVGAMGFPYGFDEKREQAISQFINFLTVGNPIRIIGSAALNLAYVAAGRFDMFWGNNLKPWDIAAGRILIEEAGGKVTHFDGSPHSLFNQTNIVATNTFLHPAVLSYLQ